VRTIITGASSGIGAALARELSRRGHSLGLMARRAEMLDALVAELKTPAVALPCDATDSAAVRDAVARGEAALGGPFDLAVANAGVGVAFPAHKFDLAAAKEMVNVNIVGMMVLFDAVIPKMIERGSGHFAGVASLAGLRGLPTTAVYSSTKAAMQAFLEAVRVELAPRGIAVTTINPGFVVSPMTDKNTFKMPFLMSAERAARIIADGLDARARVVQFPLPMSLLMRFARTLPNAVYDRALRVGARRR
jgi:short-subunit dehydrogenase